MNTDYTNHFRQAFSGKPLMPASQSANISLNAECSGDDNGRLEECAKHFDSALERHLQSKTAQAAKLRAAVDRSNSLESDNAALRRSVEQYARAYRDMRTLHGLSAGIVIEEVDARRIMYDAAAATVSSIAAEFTTRCVTLYAAVNAARVLESTESESRLAITVQAMSCGIAALKPPLWILPASMRSPRGRPPFSHKDFGTQTATDDRFLLDLDSVLRSASIRDNTDCLRLAEAIEAEI